MIEWNLVSLGFTAVYLIQLAFVVLMEMLNRKYLRENNDAVPESMKGFIDENKLALTNAYSLDNSKLLLAKSLVDGSLVLALILTGSLNWLNGFFSSFNYLFSGLGFFLTIAAFFFLLELPFDYYDTFVLEEKYGFNRSDLRTWITDNLKGAALSAILLVIILGPLLWTIEVSPKYWWLLGFSIVGSIQFLLVVLYPVIIAPLFNKFEPLQDEELAEKVNSLVRETGMRTQGIFQMDAGRRSAHSNAYFTGFGKAKRIVLFDTLLGSHTHDEILGVLAHELGHFKLKHVVKTYVLGLGAMLAVFYTTYLLLNWPGLYGAFGLIPGQYHVALFIFSIFWSKLLFFLRPVGAGMSRQFERSADEFASKITKNPEPLATALKKLGSHNLSNLNPHPFYVWFNYSHPPLLERVRRLDEFDAKSEGLGA